MIIRLASSLIAWIRGVVHTASDVWRSPVFRREIGLLGRSGVKRWRNPLWRTAFFCLLMLVGPAVIGRHLESTWGWRLEKLIFPLTGGYLLLAIFLPAFIMNRRMVRLIKTGQLEHLSLTLAGPDEIIRSYVWSNFLRFWPLVPAGIIGVIAMIAAVEGISRHEWDDAITAAGIAIYFTTFYVLVNPTFALWITWRFYRTGLTLFFAPFGIAAMNVAAMFTIIGFIALFDGWIDEWAWATPIAGISLMLWLIFWGHARAYLDGNYIEELTGGRDTPHHPYGGEPLLRLGTFKPMLKAFTAGHGWLRLILWLAISIAAGLLAGYAVPYPYLYPDGPTLFFWDRFSPAFIAVPIGCMVGWTVWSGIYTKFMWTLFEPFPPDENTEIVADAEPQQAPSPPSRRLAPFPVAQALLYPTLLELAIFSAAYYFAFIEDYPELINFNFFGFSAPPNNDISIELSMGALVHIVFYVVAFAWLAARRWQRGLPPQGFLRRAIAMVVIVEGGLFVLCEFGVVAIWAPDSFYSQSSERYLFDPWLALSVLLLPPAAGIMFVKILKILRHTGVKISDI